MWRYVQCRQHALHACSVLGVTHTRHVAQRSPRLSSHACPLSLLAQVSEPSQLKAVGARAEAAIAMLSSQRDRIADELSSRRGLIMLLSASVERQNEQCERLEEALRGCESLLTTARGAEEQVSSMAAQMASISAMASEAL